jgi:PII-like signaling protein
MMPVFIGEDGLRQGAPLPEAIAERLRAIGVGGATVFRGVRGSLAKGGHA